jgi:hypothetical protein
VVVVLVVVLVFGCLELEFVALSRYRGGSVAGRMAETSPSLQLRGGMRFSPESTTINMNTLVRHIKGMMLSLI